ncbi:MAG TPA: CHC2 zinc finger domain-containing protein, partial [Phenylobacterium sp.]
MVGRFDERFLDEIKSRLRPSDVIGKTVKLRRQGREYVGLSPFTKEKTPSFYVNDDKGQFFDFSSGKTGDLISFLQETERLTFVEAVERLA